MKKKILLALDHRPTALLLEFVEPEVIAENEYAITALENAKITTKVIESPKSKNAYRGKTKRKKKRYWENDKFF